MILMVVVIGVASWWGRTASTESFVQGPNLVLITLDTTRADRLSCYDSLSARTPNLDRLARHGVRFSRAISSAAVTPVSHASMMTGLYPHAHGLRVLHGHEGFELDEKQITLAEVLGENGYRTGAFVSAFPATRYFGLDQGFDLFDQEFPESERGVPIPLAEAQRAGLRDTGQSQRGARETTDAALNWLGRLDSQRPFFLWVHYFDPHDIQLAPPIEYLRRAGIDRRPTTDDEIRRLYDVEVEYMDEQIGRLLRDLDLSFESAPKNRRETIVAVVSDHGEGLGDHDWWAHGILYQEQIRVPLILFGGSFRTGTAVDSVVRTVDLYPTLLEAAGIAELEPRELDGESLQTLTNPGATPATRHRTALADSINLTFYYWNIDRKRRNEKDERLYSLIDWPWKLIHHQYRPTESELYNLQDDPDELHNLAASRADKRSELEAQLRDTGAVTDRDFQDPLLMDPEMVEKLKALGYLGEEAEEAETDNSPTSQPNESPSE